MRATKDRPKAESKWSFVHWTIGCCLVMEWKEEQIGSEMGRAEMDRVGLEHAGGLVRFGSVRSKLAAHGHREICQSGICLPSEIVLVSWLAGDP